MRQKSVPEKEPATQTKDLSGSPLMVLPFGSLPVRHAAALEELRMKLAVVAGVSLRHDPVSAQPQSGRCPV